MHKPLRARAEYFATGPDGLSDLLAYVALAGTERLNDLEKTGEIPGGEVPRRVRSR